MLKTNYRFSSESFLIALLDSVIVTASMLLAFIVRFDFSFKSAVANELFGNFIAFLPIRIVICIATLAIFKAYNVIWRYISISDLSRILFAVITMDVATFLLSQLLHMNMSKTVYFLTLVFDLAAISGLRVSYRLVRLLSSEFGVRKSKRGLVNTMIIGAGETGLMAIN